MNDKPPTFGDWLLALPWWAKLLITLGTVLGVYVAFAPLLRG